MKIMYLPWDVIQTMFFLKLVVSGHMLVYVAHTKQRWWRFLPSRQVITATLLTQIVATSFAIIGIFTAPVAWPLIVIVWIWAFIWMQVAEGMKDIARFIARILHFPGTEEIHTSV